MSRIKRKGLKRKDIQEAEDKYFLRARLLEVLATKLYKDALKNQLEIEKGENDMARARDAKGRFVKENEIKKEENKTMKSSRNEVLEANGVDTSKFYNISMNIPFGAEVKIIVGGKEFGVPVIPGKTMMESYMETDGIPVVEKETLDVHCCSENECNLCGSCVDLSEDPIAQAIIENGYVRNTKIHRRWITAQTFAMLNYESYYNKNRKGWECCMTDNFDYNYQFKMMLEEIRVLSILQKEDMKMFKERSIFFNESVINKTLKNYRYRLEKYVNNWVKRKNKKCHGRPYVKLCRYGEVFLKNIDKEVYERIDSAIRNVYHATLSGDYTRIYFELKRFMDKYYNKLPYNTPKCQSWKDAFKASGAFYSLQNCIRFNGMLLHGCKDKYESEQRLYEMLYDLDEEGETWRLHKVLVDAIEYNEFDLRKAIAKNAK